MAIPTPRPSPTSPRWEPRSTAPTSTGPSIVTTDGDTYNVEVSKEASASGSARRDHDQPALVIDDSRDRDRLDHHIGGLAHQSRSNGEPRRPSP